VLAKSFAKEKFNVGFSSCAEGRESVEDAEKEKRDSFDVDSKSREKVNESEELLVKLIEC
jgi:hypothetical protein